MWPMKRITVVQARMGSTRLPGKVLELVGDRTILEWVVFRVRLACVGPIIVTTSTDQRDDPIREVCDRLAVSCFRGMEHDVLDRFYRTAKSQAAESVVRITADCPLLCPSLLAETVALYEHHRADYAAVRASPRGFGQEVISGRALQHAWRNADSLEDREHVVTYTLAHPDEWPAVFVNADPFMVERQDWRLCVDTRDDLRLLRRLYKRSKGQLFRWGSRQIVDLVESESACLELATHEPLTRRQAA